MITYSINSSRANTELCQIGMQCGTDKSPFNRNGHRHPYTPFYSMLFAPKRALPIRFAEIGVAAGASVHMWARYFQSGQLYFFDRDLNFLSNAQSFGYPNTSFGEMDVRDANSIRTALAATGGNLDVILDDSSHDIEHQYIIIKEAMKFLKPGGMLLIEDVFRTIPDEAYESAIAPIKNELSFYAFYEMEHENKWSPGWDNDKILMLVKKF